MKKSTIFLFTIGSILMIVGGLGSIYYYQKVEETLLHNVNKEYEILDRRNTEELQINIANNHNLILIPSEDNQFHLEGNYYDRQSLLLDWTFTEKNGKIILDLTNTGDSINFSFNPFSIWNRETEQIFLHIPKEFSNVTINNSNGDIKLNDLKLEKLKITNKNGDMDVYHTTSENIEIQSNLGSIYLGENTQALKIQLSTSNSDITLVNVEAEQISAETINGDLEFDKTQGNITAKNTNGDISIRNSTENLDLQNQNGNISIQLSKIQQNITAHSSKGDVSLDCSILPTDTEIQARSKLGKVELFDKETTQYQKGAKNYTVKVTSALGNVSVNKEDFDGDYEEYID